MNTSTTGMCVLQTTDEVDIGGHYNSTLEQRQCFVLTVLTLPQTAPERMSNVGHSRAAIGQSEGRYPLTCIGHPPCRTPPNADQSHWLTIFTIGCFHPLVKVYDSLAPGPDSRTVLQSHCSM